MHTPCSGGGQTVSITNHRCVVPQASFEMTFVAKGYSRYWASRPPVEAEVEGDQDGDPDAVESATAVAKAPPVPEGGPDVTVVTVVKGPEPGKLLICALIVLRIFLFGYHSPVTWYFATRSQVSQRAHKSCTIARCCATKRVVLGSPGHATAINCCSSSCCGGCFLIEVCYKRPRAAGRSRGLPNS